MYVLFFIKVTWFSTMHTSFFFNIPTHINLLFSEKMPAKKGKAAPTTANKRGRPPKKSVKKTPAKAAPKKSKPEETRSEGEKSLLFENIFCFRIQ